MTPVADSHSKTNPQFTHAVFLCAVLIVLSACKSVPEAERMSMSTKAVPIVTTQDAVVTGISAELAQNLGKNISKQLVQGLEDRGIAIASGERVGGKDAVVTIDVTGIQGQNVFDAGPFGASSKNVFRITYTATLVAPEGKRLFRFQGSEKSSVLDELPGVVGRYVAKRTAEYYAQKRR